MSRFDRFKGAIWFEWLKGRDVILGGTGGIGSFVNFFLSRLGCNIYIYDMDVFEEHNMSGQLVRLSDMGKPKTEVAINIAKEFSNHTDIQALGKYEKDSEYCPIMIAGFDNMEARKNMFLNWKQGLIDNPELERESLYIDGRLLAETYQIFCIKGWDKEAIENYEKNFLFDDSEVEEVDCTFKQTTHCAAGIASHMIGFLTNFATLACDEFADVPFYFEYFTPLNYVANEVVSNVSMQD